MYHRNKFGLIISDLSVTGDQKKSWYTAYVYVTYLGDCHVLVAM